MRQPPTVGIIYSFGRSGSTLLNQCLGCHSANAVLSEVNPAGSYFDVAWQAHHWLGLASDQDRIEIERLPYAQQIGLLADACTRAHRHLIVRDWTALNFLKNVMPDVEPSGLLEQEWFIGGLPLNLRRVVFCRRAGGVYHSFCSRFPQFRDLPAGDFAGAYLAYARAVCHFPIVHLEDFTARPKDRMKEICRLLGAAYAINFAEKFADYRNCTGNTTLTTETSSTTLRSIVRTDPPVGPPPHPLFLEADQLLGYEPA